MKCKVCRERKISIYKSINGVNISECSTCRIAYIDNNVKEVKNLNRLYSFNAYKQNEKLFTLRLNDLLSPLLRIVDKGSVLEIGPGYGLLSSLLLQKGKFNLDVVEPSLTPHYLKKLKYTLHKQNLDQFLKSNKKKFDVIIMFDVIEHLEDPFKSLKKLHEFLKKDGILVVQTPNYRSIMQYSVKNWSWWMIEDHKWFFSAKSLKSTLNKYSFELRYFRTYEDWVDFRKNLDGNFTHIKSPIIRKLIKGLFLATFMPLYFLLRPLLWKAGYGGLLFSISQKQ